MHEIKSVKFIEITNNLGGEKSHLDSKLEVRFQGCWLDFKCWKAPNSLTLAQ